MKLGAGNVAVVTGAAKGIGYSLAQAFASAGVSVVMADKDEQTLFQAKSRLEAQGAKVAAVPADVSDAESVSRLRDKSLAAFGRVDVICNNAGVYFGIRPAWELDLAAWRSLLETNYWGVVHGIRTFVPLFIEQGVGHVVNTASMSALTTVPGHADYGSVKHAVVAMSEILRADLDAAGHRAIGVSVLCPAIVMTEMGERALSSHKAHHALDGAGSGPNLAAVVRPDDLARLALEGIEAGHLYVFPTPGSLSRFEKRVSGIRSAFENYPTAAS